MRNKKLRTFLLFTVVLILPVLCFASIPRAADNISSQTIQVTKNNRESQEDPKSENQALPQVQPTAAPAPTSSPIDGTSSPEAQKQSAAAGKTLGEILKEKGIDDLSSGQQIVVDKSDHTLSIVYQSIPLKSYHVELGSGGSEDKNIEGDKKTPLGKFYVTDKTTIDPEDEYLGTRWLGVSYPNAEDAERGLEQGLIDRDTYNAIIDAINQGTTPPQETALGGNIGIHGGSTQSLGADWTWGCVGLSNKDIEDFYEYIPVGTPIIIQQ